VPSQNPAASTSKRIRRSQEESLLRKPFFHDSQSGESNSATVVMRGSLRRRTVREALRVLKPGGKMVCVDYHRPSRLNPLRYVMIPVLKYLEPFAMDLWRTEVAESLPATSVPPRVHKRTYFGGLYQKVTVTT
jgi:SAM-dependent methyltransferase